MVGAGGVVDVPLQAKSRGGCVVVVLHFRCGIFTF